VSHCKASNVKVLQSLFIPDCEVEQAVATVMYKLKTERPTQNTAKGCKEFDANTPGAKIWGSTFGRIFLIQLEC